MYEFNVQLGQIGFGSVLFIFQHVNFSFKPYKL